MKSARCPPVSTLPCCSKDSGYLILVQKNLPEQLLCEWGAWIPSGTAQSWVDSPPSLSRERPRPHQLNPSARTTCRTKVCAGHYENKGQFQPQCASPCPPVSFHYLPLLFRGNSKLYYWLKLKIMRKVSLLQKSMNCKIDWTEEMRFLSPEFTKSPFLLLLSVHPTPYTSHTFPRGGSDISFTPRDMTTLGGVAEKGRKSFPPPFFLRHPSSIS